MQNRINIVGCWAGAPMALVLGALLLLTQGCTSTPPRETTPATTLQRAEAAYRANDYVTTRRLLLPLAEAGNPRAQYVVGYMIFYGQGGPANETLARTWFQRSAAQGFPKAEIALDRITMAGKMKAAPGAQTDGTRRPLPGGSS